MSGHAQAWPFFCGRDSSGMLSRRLKWRPSITTLINIYDEVEQVGEVVHERFIIDVDKYTERLRKKIAG